MTPRRRRIVAPCFDPTATGYEAEDALSALEEAEEEAERRADDERHEPD